MSAPSEPSTTVSVVVPAYRRPDRLRTCLAALAAQDYPHEHLEVVVVDDGSPVPLAEVEPEFADRVRLTVHRQTNAGPATARNVGAGIATGELLVFTDDDCEPDPGWVRELVAAHTTDPAAMIGGDVVNALADQICAEASQLLVSFLYDWFDDGSPSRFFASNNLALPRKEFLADGGFDTTFPLPGGEDRELCERWTRSGASLERVPGAVVRHSHVMGLRAFFRQHVNYGRGAYSLHRRRSDAGGGGVRVEGVRFYWGLLTYPVGRSSVRRVVPLVALMGVSQVGTAVGFFLERRSQQRHPG